MANLDVNLRPVPSDQGAIVAELVGVIDGSTVSRFQATLEDLLKRGVRKVILDMNRVRYVNSTGLGALVQYADKFKAASGGIALIRVTAKVRIVIEMLGLQAFFEICADESAALGALDKGGASAPPPAPASAPSPPAQPPPARPPVADGPPSGRFPPPSAARTQEAPIRSADSGRIKAGGEGSITCQGCDIEIAVPAPGNWKCPRCGALLTLKPDGSVEFGAPDKAPAFELAIVSTREGTDALMQFAAIVGQPSLNGDQKLEMLRAAVGEVAYVIASTAYKWRREVYHVAIEPNPGEVKVCFADHGDLIEPARFNELFKNATRATSEFECRPHPRGGNIIRFTVKA